MMMLYINLRPLSKIQTATFGKRFGLLVEDMKLTDKFYVNYFSFFIIRRLLFLVTVFYTNTSASMQRISMFYVNLLMMEYVTNNPFNDRFLYKL